MAHAETDPLLEPPSGPRRILFVASTGGHLAQLERIASRLAPADDSLWVTFDSPQSRSLLRDKRVIHVPYVAPRDWRGMVRAARFVRRGTKGERFDLVVSTGAAVAVGILLMMRAAGVPAHYVESVSRTHGPSLTGRMLAATRLVSMRTQHASWASGQWRPFPPVLGMYESQMRERPARVPRLFVTLGTIRPYRFDALVDALVRSGAADESTVWQLGETTRDDLPGKVHGYMDDAAFTAACSDADVMLTHAGVGTILGALELGVHPVVVPRRRARGEHVDDHQEQIAELVAELGIAESVEADGDLLDAIGRASERRIVRD